MIDYGLNPDPQLTLQQIQQVCQQKLDAGNKLDAVLYLINVYQMNKFGSYDISNQTIQIQFDSNPNPTAQTLELLNTSTGFVYYQITINEGLLNYSDFVYVLRGIRHEMYHVLQHVVTPTVGHNLREFDAYYNSIFKFKSLPKLTNFNSIKLLASQAHRYYSYLTDAEKNEVSNEYDILNAYYPIKKPRPDKNCP